MNVERKIEKQTVRRNFIMLPHMIMDSDLSSYARTLYEVLVRTVGFDLMGLCYKSERVLSRECNISITSVVKAKKELVLAGFIEVGITQVGMMKQHLIKVIDVWDENNARS